MVTPQLINVEDLNNDWPKVEITKPIIFNPYTTNFNYIFKFKKVWVKARPLSYNSFWIRFKLAYLVFIGKYDALKWEE